jgi:hypothetical protein
MDRVPATGLHAHLAELHPGIRQQTGPTGMYPQGRPLDQLVDAHDMQHARFPDDQDHTHERPTGSGAWARESDRIVAGTLAPDALLAVDASGCIVLITPERRITVTNVDAWRDRLAQARVTAAEGPPVAHRHHYQGSTQHHAHTGGGEPHGYYGHPEGRASSRLALPDDRWELAP